MDLRPKSVFDPIVFVFYVFIFICIIRNENILKIQQAYKKNIIFLKATSKYVELSNQGHDPLAKIKKLDQ